MKREFSIPIPRTNRQFQFTAALVVIFALFAVFVVLFAKLADAVVDHDTQSLDVKVLHSIHNMATPALDQLMPILTNIGGPIGSVVLAGIPILALWLMKRRRQALIVVISCVGALALSMTLKAVFERPRPEEWPRLVHEASFSFPSGHAMGSAALGLALVAAMWQTKWRWPVTIGAVLYILLIGFSRLYLGVHYPTDILAGWLVSGAWVSVVVILLYGKFSKYTPLTN